LSPSRANGESLAGPGPVAASERIQVLDVLRGIALFGMFLVHFVAFSRPAAGPFGRWVELANGWFFQNRFATMFATLFGVGFAVQLSRAEARGDRFALRYGRRLLALAAFGIIAQGFFGFPVLLGYAIWGLPLLLIRKWSNRALLVTLFLCLYSTPLYWLARASYDVAIGDKDRYEMDGGLCAGYGLPFVTLPSFGANKLCQAERTRRMEYQRRLRPNQSADYATLVRQRFAATWAEYAHPWPMTFLPTNVFSLFLVGLLGFRIGVFQRPREHMRLIIGFMVFGIASSVLSTWFLYQFVFSPSTAVAPLFTQVAAGFLALPLLRDVFLAFVYFGAVLLLAARSSAWLYHLRPFAITGRMALTNYVLQVMILDLIFRKYGLGLSLRVEYAPVAALALFAADLAFSAWWQARYRYGPLEWLWRSITYWHIQPIRQRAGSSDVALLGHMA
jgi:uncharacterized protein